MHASLQQLNGESLEALGLQVLAGRSFLPTDTLDREKVVVINKALADEYWAGESPVGRRITVDLSPTTAMVTIVGVVSDARLKGVQSEIFGEIFLPLTQWPYPTVYVVAKTALDPLSLAQPIRAAVSAVDRDIPVFDIRTMKDVFDQSLWQPRLSVTLIGAFSLLALALSAAGVFALVSYTVARRTQELGLRIMVGATRADILGLVVRHGLKLAAFGLVIGVAASLLLSRLLTSQLYEIRSNDPQTLAAVSGLVLIVAVCACLLPAWRASRVDPIAAFRME
jgi:putative ABC transport system permease protein